MIEDKRRVQKARTYLDTNARMTGLIEVWSILETSPRGNFIKHQAPLIGGRRRIFKKVVQYDLGFVGDEASLKEIEAYVIEFKTFALVQGPVDAYQVNSRGKNIGTDIMKLSLSVGNFSSSHAFLASLRTSTPEWKELAQNEMPKGDAIQSFAPKSMHSPRLFGKIKTVYL
jgi:hypothetical protein